MLLPIGDTPNPRGTPYVTWGLIAVNIAVYLLVSLPLSAMRPDPSDPWLYEYVRTFGNGMFSIGDALRAVSAYDLVVFRFGFRPADPSLLSLFTAMFLHGGFLHVAGNMLFLWIFGDNVEHRLGSFAFLLAYLGTGVAATLVFALFAGHSPYPMVGASGAISGVLGSYFIWFPQNRVKTFVFLFPIFMHSVMIPARWVLGFYLLVDNLLPFLGNGGAGTGVAHGAHIGGFLAGLGLAWGLDRFASRTSASRGAGRQRDHRVSPGTSDVPTEAFSQRVGAGSVAEALRLYARLNRSQRLQLAAEDVLLLGEALFSRGDYQEALGLYRRFIAERPTDANIDRAFLGAGKVLLQMPRGATSAYHYFLSALDATRRPVVADEARRLLEQIRGRSG